MRWWLDGEVFPSLLKRATDSGRTSWPLPALHFSLLLLQPGFYKEEEEEILIEVVRNTNNQVC